MKPLHNLKENYDYRAYRDAEPYDSEVSCFYDPNIVYNVLKLIMTMTLGRGEGARRLWKLHGGDERDRLLRRAGLVKLLDFHNDDIEW